MQVDERLANLPNEVKDRLVWLDPRKYCKTRNYTDGEVSELGPYLTHGILNARNMLDYLIAVHGLESCEGILSQLAWREFYRGVWQQRGNDIFKDLKNAQHPVERSGVPQALIHAQTGIEVIDDAVIKLYSKGRLHNHERLWLASLVCNLARFHWSEPSRWLYYNLLDGDLASNALSWQWVAGSFSHKKYYCNQSNLNKFSRSVQKGTVIDRGYDELMDLRLTGGWEKEMELKLEDQMPEDFKNKQIGSWVPRGDLFVHSLWSMDPQWSAASEDSLILLEPSIFSAFPMSKLRWRFICDAIDRLPNCKVVYAEVMELEEWIGNHYTYVAHPMTRHWNGLAVQERQLFPQVKGYFPSFSKFWKRAQHDIKDLGNSPFSY